MTDPLSWGFINVTKVATALHTDKSEVNTGGFDSSEKRESITERGVTVTLKFSCLRFSTPTGTVPLT